MKNEEVVLVYCLPSFFYGWNNIWKKQHLHAVTLKCGEKIGAPQEHAVCLLCVVCLFSFYLSLFAPSIVLQSHAEWDRKRLAVPGHCINQINFHASLRLAKSYQFKLRVWYYSFQSDRISFGLSMFMILQANKDSALWTNKVVSYNLCFFFNSQPLEVITAFDQIIIFAVIKVEESVWRSVWG